MCGFRNLAESVSTLLKNGAIVRSLGDTGTKMAPSLLLGCQVFQRGFIRRNPPRDDEARLKSLEKKPWVPADGPWVLVGGVNCSLYAVMELSSSFSVLGKLLPLVRNENLCSPWSFSAPSSEDLAWISNQVDPTRFFMIFHADHTCSWESRWPAAGVITKLCRSRRLIATDQLVLCPKMPIFFINEQAPTLPLWNEHRSFETQSR